jgi:hypothetical protein
MTETAITIGSRMEFMFADSSSTIVAPDASTCNTSMIKCAIRCQFQEAGGRVAVITFGICLNMKFGFTDGDCIVMTVTAYTENLLMIGKADKAKSKSSMTSLTGITGGKVIR